MTLYLVHHADAVGPDVDPARPLSSEGRASAERTAAAAAANTARPTVVWHSGKLRARQTAEIYWRACNALAEFSASRDLQPDDQPMWMADRLRGEERDVMLVGHYPYLPRLHALLIKREDATFPQHGVVALFSDDSGESWRELWRVAAR